MYDGVFEVLQWLLFLSAVPPVQLLTGWCVTAKAPPDISAISALTAVKHGNCSSLTPLLNPVRTRRAAFHGEVVRPACTLAMEDAWQIIDMGETPVRDLQNGFSGPERKFSLRLRNCEFNSQGGNLFSDSRIRVTFDGVRGETPDKFNLSGQAKGINLQIADARGNIARAGKVMPAIPLTGNEEALDYTLRIVRNGKKLEAGNYFAVLGFRVDYE